MLRLALQTNGVADEVVLLVSRPWTTKERNVFCREQLKQDLIQGSDSYRLFDINCAELSPFDLAEVTDIVLFWRYDIWRILKLGELRWRPDCANYIHRNLQFTMENEVGNPITFLDMKIIRSTRSRTFWYSKPNDTCSCNTVENRLIHYRENHDWRYQFRLISQLGN